MSSTIWHIDKATIVPLDFRLYFGKNILPIANKNKITNWSLTLSQSIHRSWDWKCPFISKILIYPSASWVKKNKPKIGLCKPVPGVCVSCTICLVKLLPVRELVRTNVSKAIYTQQSALFFQTGINCLDSMARFIRKLNSAPPPNRPNEREGQRGRIQPPVNTTFGEFMTLDLRFVSSRLRAGCWWRTPGCVKALMTLRQPGQLCINLHTCVLGHVCARACLFLSCRGIERSREGDGSVCLCFWIPACLIIKLSWAPFSRIPGVSVNISCHVLSPKQNGRQAIRPFCKRAFQGRVTLCGYGNQTNRTTVRSLVKSLASETQHHLHK